MQEDLILKNKTLSKYHRLNTLNIVKFLNTKDQDTKDSNRYLYENIKRINDSINKKPIDSLLYIDYFSMKMFLNGKNKTLIEIDSMQKNNKSYSDVFYEILRENIQVYPEK
ncbi:hypothetical protein [Flavobacterium kingsejongi]|uniref:Uncharacterized protein n=1 Tax=Flavobacterium kingsejongi TaxID=1678728 RepID=A0A2S1LTB8_9FLAO|nr:hypothetical protein [Flavobacterium kingsejongi]AWG26979.1 hypothetical protein FK004_17935 [Flavobacterium kingsejongi]